MTRTKSSKAPRDSIHQLKVTLRMIKPPIWRRLLVPSETTLDTLHDILQVAMGWEGEHLHSFRVGKTTYSDPEFGGDMGDQDERKTRLELVAPGKRSLLIYEYDFGDGWEHEIVVEAVQAPDPGVRYPICVEGKRACPPEDCGGPWGYESLLAVVADPKHPEREDMVDWLGESFDPEVFDMEEVNGLLRGIH